MAAMSAVRLVISSLPRSGLRGGRFSRALLVGAGAAEDARDADVRLVARELEDWPVGFLQIVEGRPGTRPRLRIIDRELVFDLIVRDARETLGDLHGVRRSAAAAAAADGITPVEIRRLDDERLAFPAAARHPDPLLQAGRRRRTVVERDDPRVVDHLGQDHDVPLTLDDVIGAV